MILLEDTNTLIQTLLLERLAKPSSLDQLFTDFDGVAYRLSTPEKANRGIIILSMSMRQTCWDELVAYGALDALRREYGEYLLSEVEGNTLRSDGSVFAWDVTLKFDIGPDGLGGQPEDQARETIRKLSMIKRSVRTNILGENTAETD